MLSNNLEAREPDRVAAEAMLNIAKDSGCCALRLNAGAWYFGAQVVRRGRNLRDSLTNVSRLEEVV